MSRNPDGRQFDHSCQYNKAHIFEKIKELYQIACLTYGYSPIRFTRGAQGEHNQNSDYGLCTEVIEEAKKIRDAGGGHIAFSTIPEKEARRNGGYTYRVYTSRDRNGSDDDPCGNANRSSDVSCSCV